MAPGVLRDGGDVDHGRVASASDLVGRDAERAVAGQALARAESGTVGLLVEGDTGMGKSALVGWMIDRVGDSHHVLLCRPTPSEAQLAYVALGDLLGGAMEEIAGLVSEPRRLALSRALSVTTSGPVADWRAVAAGLFESIRSLAQRRPVVIAIDGLEWLDEASAHVLAFVLRRFRHEPILIVATRRPGRRGPLRFDDVIDGARLLRIALGPLDAALLAGLVQGRAPASLDRETLTQIVRVSAGNPLFALELAAAPRRLSGVRSETFDELLVPEKLRLVLIDRLAGLDAAAARALTVAAALARPTVA
ncbi:MAG: AAA family ATPase, partial [Acidimicrobiales bacterium]